MKGMRKKHGKRAEEVFHRTANKYGQTPRSNMPEGASMSPSGHICCDRAKEGKKVGGFGDRHMMMGL